MNAFRSSRPHQRRMTLDGEHRPPILETTSLLAGPSVQTQARLEGAQDPPETIYSRSADEQHQGHASPIATDPDCPAPDQTAGQPATDAPSPLRRGDVGADGTSHDGHFFTPDVDAKGRDFTGIAPFVPTEAN